MDLQALSAWIESVLNVPVIYQVKIIQSFALIFALWLIKIIIIKISSRTNDDIHFSYRVRKTTTYVTMTLSILLVGRIWFTGFASLATFLGLLSAGVALALKDIITSIAGWIFLMLRRPFEVGDRIQLGDFKGDVIDIRLFQFTLMEIGNWVHADQSTGRIIHVPNGMILHEVLANYSKGFQFIWHELEILVTFETNWQKAKEILQEIADKHASHSNASAQKKVREASRKFLIFYSKLTPIVYTSVKDSGVMLTLRYLTEPRKRRGTEQAIWEDILTEFANHKDIDFAYPTQRFYNNVTESKINTNTHTPL